MSRIKTSVITIAFLTILPFTGLAQEEEMLPGEWRADEVTGGGIGLVTGLGAGSQLFLDYNITESLQFHGASTFETLEQVNLFGGVILSTERSMLTGSIRFFPSQDSGWYVGGGAGFGTATQEYTFDATANSEATFIPVFFDGGWQGWDGYYFTINMNLGSTIILSEEDNTDNLPTDYLHRKVGQEDWESAKSLGGLVLGFGWHF